DRAVGGGRPPWSPGDVLPGRGARRRRPGRGARRGGRAPDHEPRGRHGPRVRSGPRRAPHGPRSGRGAAPPRARAAPVRGVVGPSTHRAAGGSMSLTALERSLREDGVLPFYVLVGDAAPLREEAVDLLLSRILPTIGPPAFNHGSFRLSQDDPSAPLSAARTLPMLS